VASEQLLESDGTAIARVVIFDCTSAGKKRKRNVVKRKYIVAEL
jgi:hypothetical protein